MMIIGYYVLPAPRRVVIRWPLP